MLRISSASTPGSFKGEPASPFREQRECVFAVILGLLFLGAIIAPLASALPAGFQEFYLPLPAAQTQDAFVSIRTGPTELMHYIVGVTASADNTVIYYDHWENGLAGPGVVGADEIFYLSRGQIKIFEGAPGNPAANIPTSPRGTATYYDGGDRVFVSGSLLQLVVSTWPPSVGTVFSDAWEVYPVQAWNREYIVPVGENLAVAPFSYIDFRRTWIQVMSGSDGNSITITPPSGTPVTATLNKGQTYSYRVLTSGTRVTSSAPVQVQVIAGDTAVSYAMRGITIAPRQYWGTSYYAPVTSWTSPTTVNTDLFLYNPNPSAITVTYQTRTGSGSFSIGAGATLSYRAATGSYVPVNSGVYLSSNAVFWGISSVDTASASRDWAYSLVPVGFLGTDNYVSWAPGTRTLNANGSPVFISATGDATTVYVYFAPDDGVPDRTITLDRLQTVEVYDPDNDNSGMHIVSTAPVAIAWGESPVRSTTADPYLDMGYTTLPLPTEWIEVALDIQKTVEPGEIRVGDQSLFTFNISVPGTAGAPATNINLVDVLPLGWEYVPGSTTLNGAPYADPNFITGSLAAGYTLNWTTGLSVNPGSFQTVSFLAQSTPSVSPYFPNRNVVYATGESQGTTRSCRLRTLIPTQCCSTSPP